MSAHTPGPWIHLPISSKSPDLGLYTENGSLICRVQRSGSSVSLARREADAALLASAPELLVALQDIVRLIEDGGLLDEFDARQYRLESARAAITKATRP